MDNKTSNQSLDEWMRPWDIWNSFNFRNAQDSEVCLPLMKPIQRVVIGTEIFWKTCTSNGFLKHPTKRQAINNATLDPKSDDSARVLIHNDQLCLLKTPIGSEILEVDHVPS